MCWLPQEGFAPFESGLRFALCGSRGLHRVLTSRPVSVGSPRFAGLASPAPVLPAVRSAGRACRGQWHVKQSTAVDDAGAGQRRSESEGGCHPAAFPRGGRDRTIDGGGRNADPPFPARRRITPAACSAACGRTEGRRGCFADGGRRRQMCRVVICCTRATRS